MSRKSDQQLKDDILDELRWSPNVSDTDVGVTVHDGVVTLTGSVPNFAEKYAAERAVLRVHGVRGVAEKIEVKLAGSHKRDDTDIAEAVSNALKLHVTLPDNLTVTVEQGRVTLKGDVSGGHLRDLAAEAVRFIRGVRDVNNHIRVKPAVRAQDVKQNIKSALRRMAEEDADHVQVESEGSKIILRGNVRSLAELEDIKWAAWAAPGVTEVESRMSVSW